jgi:bifunctional polynucleotide phosphatase/kinase
MNPEKREGLPRIAFNNFTTRYKDPTMKEGFQEIIPIEFQFKGTPEEYAVWGKYWL